MVEVLFSFIKFIFFIQKVLHSKFRNYFSRASQINLDGVVRVCSKKLKLQIARKNFVTRWIRIPGNIFHFYSIWQLKIWYSCTTLSVAIYFLLERLLHFEWKWQRKLILNFREVKVRASLELTLRCVWKECWPAE